MNSFPRLACDRAGRIWLAYRHRQEVIWGNQAVLVAGGVWVFKLEAKPKKDAGMPAMPGGGMGGMGGMDY